MIIKASKGIKLDWTELKMENYKQTILNTKWLFSKKFVLLKLLFSHQTECVANNFRMMIFQKDSTAALCSHPGWTRKGGQIKRRTFVRKGTGTNLEQKIPVRYWLARPKYHAGISTLFLAGAKTEFGDTQNITQKDWLNIILRCNPSKV